MVMHACPNCGAPVAPQAIECPKCGACFGEGSSWRPLHPIERRGDGRQWSPIAWFVSLSLVAAGLAVIPLLSHATEVLTTTLLVLPTAALGGHLIWRGVRLIRTRDFSGTKLHGAIDPKKLAAASYYFGVWEIGLGVLSASSVLVVVGQPSHRKLWIAGYLLCGLALFVAGFLFVRPRASKPPRSSRRDGST